MQHKPKMKTIYLWSKSLYHWKQCDSNYGAFTSEATSLYLQFKQFLHHLASVCRLAGSYNYEQPKHEHHLMEDFGAALSSSLQPPSARDSKQPTATAGQPGGKNIFSKWLVVTSSSQTHLEACVIGALITDLTAANNH